MSLSQPHLDELHNLAARLEALGEMLRPEEGLSFSPEGALGLWLIFREIKETVKGAAEALQLVSRRTSGQTRT